MKQTYASGTLKNLLFALAVAGLAAAGSPAAAEEKQSAGLTWRQGLAALQDGNARFVSGQRTYPDQTSDRRRDTGKNGQHPFAVILTCSDSRVPAEHVFDAGLGDIFVIRVAGNVADTDEIATVEYGIEHLKAPLVVVLGHSKCGAVTAVVKGDKVGGSLPQLVDNIVPAVEKAKAAMGATYSNSLLAAAIEDNVWQSTDDLVAHSPIISEFVRKGEVKLVGALYDIDEGTVRWLGESSRQEEMLAAAEAAPSAGGSAPSPDASSSLLAPGLVNGGLLVLLIGAYLVLFARRTRLKKLTAHRRLIASALTVSVVFLTLFGLAVLEFKNLSPTGAVFFLVMGLLSAAAAVWFSLAVVRSTNKAFKEYIGFIRENGR